MQRWSLQLGPENLIWLSSFLASWGSMHDLIDFVVKRRISSLICSHTYTHMKICSVRYSHYAVSNSKCSICCLYCIIAFDESLEKKVCWNIISKRISWSGGVLWIQCGCVSVCGGRGRVVVTKPKNGWPQNDTAGTDTVIGCLLDNWNVWLCVCAHMHVVCVWAHACGVCVCVCVYSNKLIYTFGGRWDWTGPQFLHFLFLIWHVILLWVVTAMIQFRIQIHLATR